MRFLLVFALSCLTFNYSLGAESDQWNDFNVSEIRGIDGYVTINGRLIISVKDYVKWSDWCYTLLHPRANCDSDDRVVLEPIFGKIMTDIIDRAAGTNRKVDFRHSKDYDKLNLPNGLSRETIEEMAQTYILENVLRVSETRNSSCQ